MKLFLVFFSTFFMGYFSTSASSQEMDLSKQNDEIHDKKLWKGGEFADGTTLSQEKLNELLNRHQQWIETRYRVEKFFFNMKWEEITKLIASDWEVDKGRLSLRGAKLYYVDLQGVNLSGADLQGAILNGGYLQRTDLNYVNLQDALLTAVKLQKTRISYSNLQGANLLLADLQEASISDSNLQGAYMDDAKLQGAFIGYANLQRVTFRNTNLKGTKLVGTNLQDVLYEPILGLLPDIISLRDAPNLHTLQSERSPHALYELRQAFKNVGMRQEERELTFALTRSERSGFLDLFFGLPVGYGLYPERALWIILFMIGVLTPVYARVIFRPSEDNGIYVIYPKGAIEMTHTGPIVRTEDRVVLLSRDRNWSTEDLFHAAFSFSVMSAFNLGWRDLNVGKWITLIQKDPYYLQSLGWVRTVSGFQSLLCVYLLAVCVLSYFGVLFE